MFRASSGLSFPADLGGPDNDKIIKFDFYEYKKTSLDNFETENPVGSVQLLLPPELSHGDSLEYSDFDGGIEASAVSGFDDTQFGSEGAWRRALESVGSGIVAGSSQILRTVAGNAANIADVQTGRTLNPRVLSKFERVGFKTYQFTWTMIAKDSGESEKIRQIVNTFRGMAHPAIDDEGAFFKFPNVTKFSFLPNQLNDYLWSPEPCAITAVNVTYNGSGTPKFFKDTGAPVEVVLSVQLKELLVKTQEDFKDV